MRENIKIIVKILTVLMILTIMACSDKGTDNNSAKIEKRIHLFSPWRSGMVPTLHGEINGYQQSDLALEDECGWYVFATTESNIGAFRFLRRGLWEDEYSYGVDGLGSDKLFGSTMLETYDDIWIYTDESGKASVELNQPIIDGCAGGVVIEKPGAGIATYPFPQEFIYPNVIMPEFYKWTEVQFLYELWKNRHLEIEGDLARVKFEDPDYTVSEGIGYGMLISVFMDNEANNTKGDFDKLWAYYQSFLDNYGLMHWKISGFTDVSQTYAASDAELDVALALLMAYKQWNDENYLIAAKGLIAKIKEYEIGLDGMLKPGDGWETPLNASYFSYVAFQLFAEVDIANFDFWIDVKNKHYAYVLSSRNAETGLMPNWSDALGAPADPNTGYPDPYDFSFDAIRVPWRATWSYLWYQDSSASNISSKIGTWIYNKTAGDPTLIRSAYTLDGTITDLNDYTAGPAFTGAFACAIMVNSIDPVQQIYLNALYSQLKSQVNDYDLVYYHSSLQVLYALLLTGNMPNLWGI